MAVCETQLWELVRTIQPTQTQQDGASRSQNYLRDLLDTGQMRNRIVTSYLSGSYARDTAIYPLDDVDIIFVIDPAYWTNPPNLAARLLGYPAPSTVLNSFANAIRYRYPVSSVFGQRRSVRLQLNHLDIDVVPAIQNALNLQLINIPDSNLDQWITSSPLQHAANATAVNKSRNGKFKPLVKLLKYWNGNLPGTARFKSFAIETAATRIFTSVTFDSLQAGLRFFFDFIVYASGGQTFFNWPDSYGISFRWLACNIPDIATNRNIVEGVSDEVRRRFVENATRSRDKMVESFDSLSVETACRRISEALKM